MGDPFERLLEFNLEPVVRANLAEASGYRLELLEKRRQRFYDEVLADYGLAVPSLKLT